MYLHLKLLYQTYNTWFRFQTGKTFIKTSSVCSENEYISTLQFTKYMFNTKQIIFIFLKNENVIHNGVSGCGETRDSRV